VISDLPTPKPEKARGLRRLGTVLGRRRESKIPAGAGRIAESPERKAERPQQSSGFSSFSSRMGRSKDVPTPLEPPQEEARERPRSPLRRVTSAVDEDPDAITPVGGPSTNGTLRPRTSNNANGTHGNELRQLQEPLQPSAPAALDAEPRKEVCMSFVIS
jgi:hypothetical protein